MAAFCKPGRRPVRVVHPTGDKFDPRVALEQAKVLFPKVMAKLAG